jgi:hypothetical protein
MLASPDSRQMVEAMSGLLLRQTEADTPAGTRLVDELIERYVAWRAECEAASTAYQAWSSETGPERVLWFAAFNAALDREECAAHLYEASVTRLSRVLWSNSEP